VANEIAGGATRHYDRPNLGVTRKVFQRCGEHVAHLRIEIDALCAAKRNGRDCVRYFCRQNIGVH
jgi:hypothetical protein